MSRLILVSNRLPINIERSGETWAVTRSAGGLVAGLGPIHDSSDGIWIGSFDTHKAAEHGEAAIEQVKSREGPIDLALLDVMLPDMNGVQLYPRLKELRPDLKVVVCSAYGMEGPVEEILEAGAEAFLQKPYSPGELSEAVRGVLDPRG